MSTITKPAPPPAAAGTGRSRRLWALGGIGFTTLFLAGQFASEPLRVGDIPMPDSPASEVASYFSANSTASILMGAFHILAGLALLFLVGRVATDLRPGIGSRIAGATGRAASMTLAISGVTSMVLALVADSASLATVDVLREVNFRTGGVVHVVMLGLFAGLWCLNSVSMGRVLRTTGKVLAVPAVLSVASLLWFYASVLLPLGRFSLMIWVVFAAVSLLRAKRPATT